MTRGIHHTTGIIGDAQAVVGFYAGLLGLRLVMRTVNHEDPGTLHLVYGDAHARPGTFLSFIEQLDDELSLASGLDGVALRVGPS